MLKITTTTYAKISGININEEGENHEGKIYTLTVNVDKFSDEEKLCKVGNESRTFTGLKESELSLANAYGKLMEIYPNSLFI